MNNEIHGPGNEDWRVGRNASQCNRYMFEHNLHFDITFVVGSGEEKQQISAHKYILMARSEVFEAMLVGLLDEHSNMIEIPDVDPASFRELLKYMYYDETRLDEQNAYSLLYVARKFLVTDIVRRCLQRLKTKMSVENVCTILSFADDDGTVKLCLDYIFRYPLEVLKSDGFKELSQEHIKSIVSDNRLGVREENIFDAVILWSTKQCQRQGIEILPENQCKVLGDILKLIRYGRMDMTYLSNVCKEFLPQDLYVEILECKASHIEDNVQPGAKSSNFLRQDMRWHLTCGAEVRPKEYPGPRDEILEKKFLSSTRVVYEREYKSTSSDEYRNVSKRNLIRPVFTRQSDLFKIYRFDKNSYVKGKPYDKDTPELISFFTSRDVNLRAIYLYGSCEGQGEYHIHLKIFEDIGDHLSLIHTSERNITTDSLTALNKLNIEPSIQIQAERIYTVRALFHGPPSYFGTYGITQVTKNGVKVVFISNDEFGLKLTTSKVGQFPGIVLEGPF